MLERNVRNVLTTYIPALKLNAFKFTKNTEDADDLVQDTLFKAIRFYEQYEQGTNLSGWLYVVMRNIFINKCRKEKNKRMLVTQDENISSANLLFSADYNKATDSFLIADIKAALSILPDIYRIPFLRYVEGYKYQEISTEQDVPLGTVKTRIHKARILLKKELKTYVAYIR